MLIGGFMLVCFLILKKGERMEGMRIGSLHKIFKGR